MRAAMLGLLLAATPAIAATTAEGERWVEVRYELTRAGEAMSCEVLRSTATERESKNVCNLVLHGWKFERGDAARRSYVHRVVIKD